MNINLDTRGMNDSGQFLIRSIRYFDENSTSVLIYPATDDSTDIKFFCTRKSINIKEFNKQLDFIINQQIISNAVEISSMPLLGEFIYFVFDRQAEQLVYCKDTSKVYNSYWKNYIQRGERLDANWYLIKR